MKKKFAVLGATSAGLLAPLAAWAQTNTDRCAGVGNSGNLQGVICKIMDLIRIVIPVLILGAVAYFIWGIVQFMTAHDPEEKGAARGMMIHGIIGFAVILGLWGLVNILLRTFDVDQAVDPQGLFPTF